MAVCWLLRSVTLTVNWYDPPVVGVPEIVPLLDPSVNPGGKFPEPMLQVYDPLPFAVNCAL